jgi:hypothetical protein
MKLNHVKMLITFITLILISSCAEEIEDTEFFPFHPLETEWPLIFSSSLTSASADSSNNLYVAGYCTGLNHDLNPGIGQDLQNCNYFFSKINKTTGYEWSKVVSSTVTKINHDIQVEASTHLELITTHQILTQAHQLIQKPVLAQVLVYLSQNSVQMVPTSGHTQVTVMPQTISSQMILLLTLLEALTLPASLPVQM